MRKWVILVCLVLILSGLPSQASFAALDEPDIMAETAVLIETTTGKVLYDKEKDKLMEPASTTKILTCLLALENLPLDRIITIDAETAFTEGSRIYLTEGEEMSVEHLLYALMLESANDAASALAKEISGSLEAFADLMNERASELGALQPSYRNPSGLHGTGHVATAYDLAVVASFAMQNPMFRTLVATPAFTIPATQKQPERQLINTNLLLHDTEIQAPVRGVMRPVLYEGTTGIKTGQTSRAGSCLVVSAQRDGMELIAVIFNSTEMGRYGDGIALFDFGFENYYLHHAVDASAPLESVAVRGGAVNRVEVRILEDRYLVLPKEASAALITTEIFMDEALSAPVEQDQQIGEVRIYEGGDVVGHVPIVAVDFVEEGGALSVFGIEDRVGDILIMAAIVLLSAVVLLLLIILLLRMKYARRRKARRAKRAYEIAAERQRKLREERQRRWPY